MMSGIWQKSFLGAVVLHVIFMGLLAFFGFSLVKTPEQHEPEAIHIGFVDLTVSDEEISGGSGTQGSSSPAQAMLHDAIRSAGPPIQSAVVRPPSAAALQDTRSDTAERLDTSLAAHSEPAKAQGADDGDGDNRDVGSGDTGDSGAGQGKGDGDGLGDGFQANGDGTYTALHSAGIEYSILRDAQAVYPDEARAIGYSKTVAVEARILVGLSGVVESVSILSDVPKLGFREAAADALRQMRFAPIYYRGHNIKMYFLKTIYFQP